MSSSETPSPTPIPPSHPFVTGDDHSSLLNVLGWFLVVVIVLIVLARLGTRWAKVHTIGFDDASIIISTIFAIAQTVCVSIGVKNGLGHFTGNESEAQLTMQQKAIYSFLILFVLGQFFAKLSILAFIIAVTPSQTQQGIAYGLSGVICIWMVVSVFGFAFQCDVPQTWRFIDHKCIDRVAFYTFVEVFNIVLDTSLALLPSIIIFGLRLEIKRKVITISFFMSRIFVVAASIAQLIVIYSETSDPFISWTFALLVMIIQTLGIVTACGPYLKPFLESVNSGMIGNDDIRRRAGGTTVDLYASKDSKESKSSSGSIFPRRFFPARNHAVVGAGSRAADEESELAAVKGGLVPPTPGGHQVQVSSNGDGERGSVHSQHSQSSRTHIIRQTTSYGVSSGSA